MSIYFYQYNVLSILLAELFPGCAVQEQNLLAEQSSGVELQCWQKQYQNHAY